MKKATLVLSLLIVVAILAVPVRSRRPRCRRLLRSRRPSKLPPPPCRLVQGCQDRLLPRRPAGGVFANNVYNGAKQAEADLGANVQYVFSDWDPQKMIQQFQEAAATKPDGIAVMGHPGDEAFTPADRRGRKERHHRHQPEHRAARQLSQSTRATALATSAQ